MKKIKLRIISIYLIVSCSVGSLITYLSLGGVSRLNPRRYDWIFGDNTTAYIAQLFYLSDKWRFPLAANPNYGAENTSSLFYTGPSVPIAVLQKLLGINPKLQFFGIWILLIFCLQIFLALKIAKEFNATWAQSIPFSILTVTPFLLARLQQHFWLMAHFLILWAILIGIRYFKTKKLQTINTTALVCISYLINGYIFAMVLIIVTFIFLDSLLHNKKSRMYLIKHLITTALFGITTMVLFDGFKRQASAYESFKMNFPGPHYGGFPYNFVSAINPNVGLVPYSFTNNTYQTTLNFSSTGISLGTTNGAYDGYLYLGLGIIFMLILVIVSTAKANLFANIFADRITTKLLIVFLTGIFLFSITFNVGIGNIELKLPFPYLGKWALSIFRASGRFMWIIAYLLIVILFIKLQSILNRRRFTIVVWLALILQCLDLSKPVYERYVALRDEKIPVLQFSGKGYNEFKAISKGKIKIISYPPGHGSPNWAKLNYWAWENSMRTNTLHTARINHDLLKRETAKTFVEICYGNGKNTNIYALSHENFIIFNSCDMNKYQKAIIGDETFLWLESSTK